MAAAANAAISLAVGEILAEADRDIGARGAVCVNSGKCCKFEAYGHRLYVTGVEAVHFARVHGRGERDGEEQEARNKKGGGAVSLPLFFSGEKVEGCPYQAGGMCSAREGRPLGCRVYFCDAGAQGWQNEVYEKYHARLKAVHARFGVEYRYLEWRAALRGMMEE